MKRNQMIYPVDGFALRLFVFAIAIIIVAILGATNAVEAQAQVESAGRFQYAVAVEGDMAVVGAEWYDDFKGAVWVLRRNGGQWVVEQKLSPENPGLYDHFGRTVSINDGNVVVEAPWSDSFRGTTYVFARAGGAWIQRQKLAASESAPQTRCLWTQPAVMCVWRRDLPRSTPETTRPPACPRLGEFVSGCNPDLGGGGNVQTDRRDRSSRHFRTR